MICLRLTRGRRRRRRWLARASMSMRCGLQTLLEAARFVELQEEFEKQQLVTLHAAGNDHTIFILILRHDILYNAIKPFNLRRTYLRVVGKSFFPVTQNFYMLFFFSHPTTSSPWRRCSRALTAVHCTCRTVHEHDESLWGGGAMRIWCRLEGWPGVEVCIPWVPWGRGGATKIP